ncbi:unnamed protein product [Prorocentrum cordatum]|uniref:TLC domain-containing protein n=1 Tax=Prorocentrum cordatum TaxID=2364126 RepID=A0ABN9YH36_9DINO|nr:unnamed protein product [Polarella glacialis]
MDDRTVGAAMRGAAAPLPGSLPVRPADADGFDLLTWAFCMWALLWTALFYACSYWAGALLGPRRLPPSRKAHENDCYWVGRNLVGVLHAALVAAVALPALAVLAGAPDAARFACTGHLGWCSGGPRTSAQLASVPGGELAAEAVAAAGLAFTAFIAVDLVLSVLHGYATLDHVVHHVAFVTAGLIIRWHCMLPFNAAALLSMEVSTPFLNLALLYRHRGQEFALPVKAAGVPPFGAPGLRGPLRGLPPRRQLVRHPRSLAAPRHGDPPRASPSGRAPSSSPPWRPAWRCSSSGCRGSSRASPRASAAGRPRPSPAAAPTTARRARPARAS